MIQIDVEKLMLERANQGLTAGELAEKAGLGRQTVSRIEKGEAEPRLQTVGKIAKALGRRVEDFKKEEGLSPNG